MKKKVITTKLLCSKGLELSSKKGMLEVMIFDQSTQSQQFIDARSIVIWDKINFTKFLIDMFYVWHCRL